MKVEPKEIIRSRRKTIALVIDSDGELIVRAPFYATNADVMHFVMEKQNWLVEKSMEAKKKIEERPVLTLEAGETISYLGQEYAIRKGYVDHVYFNGETFLIPRGEDARDKLIAWYKKQAAVIIKERVAEYASFMGVEPSGIRITCAKTRWGSCNYRNHLNFSWHLVMCPLEVIDYVVVHELCHIYHKDHSKSFWKKVSLYDRAYREHEQWLKDNQRLMEIM